MAVARRSRGMSRSRTRSRAERARGGRELTLSEKRAIAGRKGALARWGRRGSRRRR
jgi:hypothetical protein